MLQGLCSGHTPGGNHTLKMYTHCNVQCSTVNNSQDMEVIWVTTNRWLDGDVVYTCSGCSVQFSSVPQSCTYLWDPMDCSTPPYPSPTPRAYSNSCPLSRWCHPTILSSVIPSSSCLQSFPASGSFLVSHLFTSGGQSIGALTSASVLPMNIQDWFPLGLTGLISLQSKGLSRVFFNTSSEASLLWCSTFFMVQFSHPYMTTRKTIASSRKEPFLL